MLTFKPDLCVKMQITNREMRYVTLNVSRKEIMPSVMLTCINTDKFKTGSLSINLLTRLSRETAPVTALVPKVLRRGTENYPDIGSISSALYELYGMRVTEAVYKLGEIQSVGLSASFIDEAYVPGGGGLLEKAVSMLGEMLLKPVTQDGLLLPEYVESEREKLLEAIRGRINEKRSYSILRMLELMCCYEDYAVPTYGFEAEAEEITAESLTERYHELLSASPIEIIYCGSTKPELVENALMSALSNLPRGEIDDDIGTDIRMNSVEEEKRVFTEEMDVAQGKLAVGFRLGDCMDEPDEAAVRVFNAIYGGCLTSKLFMNVRERLSLAYFASSAADMNKGIMYVSSGIEFDKYDAALNEIFAQLDAVKKGEVSDYELSSAKKTVATDLRMIEDSQLSLELYWLTQLLRGSDLSPSELADEVEEVTLDEVLEVANSVECDAVYFLRGEDV